MRRLSRALFAAVSIITLSQVASAADLPVKAWSMPVIAPGYSWTGFYVGGNLGGGLDWAFAGNWSARAEYLYIDFGDGPTIQVAPSGTSLVVGKLTDNIVRAGINYKF